MAAHLLKTTPRLRMVVTDYDSALVAIAERSLVRFSGRVVVACVDACDLPFDDDRFDVVLSLAMLHHTGDWRRAVGEAIQVRVREAASSAMTCWRAPCYIMGAGPGP